MNIPSSYSLWIESEGNQIGVPITFGIPKGSTFMHFGQINGVLTMWRLVSVTGVVELENLVFLVLRTGQPALSEWVYRGSCIMPDGVALHLFEVRDPAPVQTTLDTYKMSPRSGIAGAPIKAISYNPDYYDSQGRPVPR